MIELNESNFNEVLMEGKVVIDAWASWCGPCKMLSPIFEKLAEEFSLKARFAKLNVDENPSLASELEIRSIPTIIVFKDGKEEARQVGAMGEGSLKEWLEKNL